MKRYLQTVSATAVIILAAASAADAQAAGNPSYTLEQSVIASGDGTSAEAGNTFSVTGATGQTATGVSGVSASYVARQRIFRRRARRRN